MKAEKTGELDPVDERREQSANAGTKRDLVIVNSEQFGYHIDTYYYCKLLRNRYRIHYVGWDHQLPKVSLDGVNTVYVERRGTLGRIMRLLRAIENCIPPEQPAGNTIIFVKYVKLANIFIRYKFRHYPLVLDIRTGSVAINSLQRHCADLLLRIEAQFFDNITVITTGLAEKLGLPRAKILPLGAEPIAQAGKYVDEIRLLYVGTLLNRDLDKALRGFAAFIDNEGSSRHHFTIIGDGPGNEQQALETLGAELGVQPQVSILGRIAHDELAEHYRVHNVGLSFVPMTSYYDVQPSTKSFEYLLSGMPVLATATREHKAIVAEFNGVLIEDSADSMCHGLAQIKARLSGYDAAVIKNHADQYRWSKITDDFARYLDGLETSF